MSELFASVAKEHQPLAARMRPQNLDEYIGQDHIVGKGRLLRRAIQADQLTSVIFYGPPGTGKTTLAKVIANHTQSNFITLNAVLTGVADIRKAIDEAENQKNHYGKKTILFVDEVHRWNKSQQDALLPWVENGTFILIGATTENPFFEVNKALVSRSRVFQLKHLTNEDLLKAAKNALTNIERGYGNWNVEFENGALEHLVETANGDARSLLNALELAVETTPKHWPPEKGATIFISKETCEESIQKKVVLYDKDGDYHYDIISAFIKSLRGRDPDAACYWLARMVKAGEDPHFIFRRMMISACEDTGLADPYAIQVVESCAAAFDRVGLPEGRYFLAHAALYLSTAPKSNSSMAFFDALAAVEKEDVEVPNHLKDGNRDAEGFGHGSGYLYPHAYRDHWIAQQYLPGALVGRVFYTPTTQGYEAKIRDGVLERRELQIAAILEGKNSEDFDFNSLKKSGHFRGFEKTEENLTFSPEDKNKNSTLESAQNQWMKRLESNRAEVLSFIRSKMFSMAQILRHSRSLVVNSDDGLLIFDLMRKSPEGLVAGLCRSSQGVEIIQQYVRTLDDLDKPLLKISSGNHISSLFENAAAFDGIKFDRIFIRDMFTDIEDIFKAAEIFGQLFNGLEKTARNVQYGEDEIQGNPVAREGVISENGSIVFVQRIYCYGQRLSKFIDDMEIRNKFENCENEFYADKENRLFAWNENDVKSILENSNLNVQLEVETINEKRRLSETEIDKWFNLESSYGSWMNKNLGIEICEKIVALLKEKSRREIFNWKSKHAFVQVKNKI